MRIFATLSLSLIAAPLCAQDYTAPRNATVPASRAERIEVIGRAGLLRIDGRNGARDVTVRGTARASSRRALDDVRLIAEERGGTIHIEADIPENRDWNDDDREALDLVIEVPSDLPIDVQDGSGDLEIRNVGSLDLRDGSGEATIEHVGGNLRATDGSGALHITDVRGDVSVSDGSGLLEIRDVDGGVEIPSKGSGPLHVTNVAKSVRVRSKGSGSVDVNHVGGDFIVDRKASGSIAYADVKGRVEVPERRRGWR
ncbi:MAG TPA: hypothetical protein VJN70_11760 [Gemmatimonadaceae bacterium]|nr:hypothetical protein [Gemmatimonadaceae bacterium]